MVRYQGRSKRALAWGTTALLLVSACTAGTPTPAPTTPAPEATPTAEATVAPSQEPNATPTATAEATATPEATPTAEPTMRRPPGWHVVHAHEHHCRKWRRELPGHGSAAHLHRRGPRVLRCDDHALADRLQVRHRPSRSRARSCPTWPPTLVLPMPMRPQWSFTIRDGVTWQDGSPVTCEDFNYGVSRTFATDIITNGPTYAIPYLDIPTDADGNSGLPRPVYGHPGAAGHLRSGRHVRWQHDHLQPGPFRRRLQLHRDPRLQRCAESGRSPWR